MSTEILPCPFCGSRCASRGTSSAKWVYCTDDDVCGYVSAERPAAIEAHNEIAAAVRDHAAVVAERDALRRALEAMVDAADHDSTPDEPEGWTAYTAAREALGVPVDVGTDAFSMPDRQTPNIAAAVRDHAAVVAERDALMASLAPTLPTSLEAELSDKLSAARRRIEALERENERLRSDLALLSERTARLMEAAVNDYRAGVVVSEASR